MGAIAAGAAVCLGAYFNHKTNSEFDPLLYVSGVATVVGAFFAYTRTANAVRNEIMDRKKRGVMPAKKRAQRRAEQYRKHREKGNYSEIVTFELRNQ